ncbi:hypothetical protein [Anianabacter salinae]|uniref:hypothetical protein n=1 Tax=Anianabacter salinae TaxID=2851023 RepID=UPI00225DF165|nr:hypothetical protein [Anianabacter salinae]MBV0913565.1 hypothetical protein [Anianabacter salinae]
MDTTKMITAGGTILASVATVGLMVWQEAQASRYDAIGEASETAAPPPAQATLLPSVSSILVQEAPAPEPAPTVTLASLEPASVVPQRPETALAPVLDPAPEDMATLDTSIAAPDAPPVVTTETPAPNMTEAEMCAPVLTADARPAGIAALTLSAPCHESQPITVEHAGLTYSDRTSDLGTYSVRLPVLSSPAEIRITFPDGEQTDVTLDVPDLGSIDRVALQWSGETGLSLHAFELGAGYDDAGHVWIENARDADHAVGGRGGFFTALGDGTGLTPKTVNIYTYPADMAVQDGVIRLSVEAEVTLQSCGRDVSGESFQRDENGVFQPMTITLSMPGCDAVGEYLVLKNLLRDMKVASN